MAFRIKFTQAMPCDQNLHALPPEAAIDALPTVCQRHLKES